MKLALCIAGLASLYGCSTLWLTHLLLCRYMVVLRSGGVYADMDVECRKPLNSLIMPRDTLIVGWENEFSSAEEARDRRYVRKRQVSVHAMEISTDYL